MKQCSVEGCENRAHARTWCRMHYERWRRTGTTDKAAPATEKVLDALWVDGGWLTVDGLALMVGLDVHTVAGVVRGLEREGKVLRREVPYERLPRLEYAA